LIVVALAGLTPWGKVAMTAPSGSRDMIMRISISIWLTGARSRSLTPMPHVTGSDVAGEVASSNAADVAIGRRVMLQPGISCGRCEACLSGKDNECASYEVLGYLHHDGGYAEYVKVPVQNLISIPDEIDFVHAAAFPLTFLTAWHMLMTCAGLKRGEDVLVLAAGSGVGQAAIQVAALHGARVFATAGSDDKLERARSLGAVEVIHHHRQDIAEEIKRLTNRRGVDVVIEHVGEATWAKSVRSLARGGRLVTCGATTGANGAINLNALFGKQLTIHGSYMGTKGELSRAARCFFAGQLRPVIDRTFALHEAADAHRRLEESEQFGKIVLEVP